ncbi:unnamed protein product [Malus baccata var. baccata]
MPTPFLVLCVPEYQSLNPEKDYHACPDDETFWFLASVYSRSQYNVSLSKEFEGGITIGAFWFKLAEQLWITITCLPPPEDIRSQLLCLGINQRRHVSGWKKKARQMGILFLILKSIPEEFNFKVPVIAAGEEENIQPIKTKAVSRTEKTSCGHINNIKVQSN